MFVVSLTSIATSNMLINGLEPVIEVMAPSSLGGTQNSFHSCHFCHAPKLPGRYQEFLSFLPFLSWSQAPWGVPGIPVIPVILVMAQVPLRELGP
jgi:hypothetical protein